MSKKSPPRHGRPAVVSPTGYLSIKEAAAARGVSYSVVYRFVKAGQVRSETQPNGVILIDQRDVKLIEKHEPPDARDRIPVQLVPAPERHKVWARSAKQQRMGVTEWLYSLADRTSGYKSPE